MKEAAPTISQTTPGEAVVSINTFKNSLGIDVPFICVGISKSSKCIAICGEVDAEDRDESLANAMKIASLWNKSNEPN